jgi:hypothetical protein
MTNSRDPLISRAASILASELHVLTEHLGVGDRFAVLPSSDLCYSLELLIPDLLRQHYPEWETESLDGIFVARATKTGETAAELLGTCILISDQTITPFLLELQGQKGGEGVASVRLALGEPGSGTLGISGPKCNSVDAKLLLANLPARVGRVQWSYTAVADRS